MPRRRQRPRTRYRALSLIEVSGKNLNHGQIADLFRVTRSTVARWSNPRCTLSEWDADRYAVKIGKHPSEIWTDWFDIELTD